MKAFAIGLALLIVLAALEPALAWARKVPALPAAHPRVLHAAPMVPGPEARLIRPPRSPNPAWDVYRTNGRYVGSDPDPRVRLMLRKDRVNEY